MSFKWFDNGKFLYTRSNFKEHWIISFVVLPDFPAAGAVAALVETMEAVRQVRSELQLNFILPTFGQHRVWQEAELMETGILQHPEGPHTFRCQEERAGYLHLLGVENDGAGVFVHIQLDTDNAGEIEGGQIGVYGEVIMEGGDGFGKTHAVPGERLAIGGYGEIFGLGLIR